MGEVLRGDRIVNTLYDVRVGIKQECTLLCSVDLDASSLGAFQDKIRNGYTVHLLADNLPAATKWNIEGILIPCADNLKKIKTLFFLLMCRAFIIFTNRNHKC